MSKVYKGYELLKAIADGEIKDGTKFKIKGLENVYKYEFGTFISEETGEELDDILSTEGIARAVFELIEDEVDIDNIEKVSIVNTSYKPTPCDMKFIAKKFNELISAVKQLNKEIQSIKEK